MMSMMNNDKTEFAIFGTRQQLNKLEHPLLIISGEELVFPLEKLRNLGLTLDTFRGFNIHIILITSSGCVCSICENLLNPKVLDV